MIKLIVTDMDGTLLDNNKRVPPELEYVLDELNRRDIKFVVASGRSYVEAAYFFHNPEKLNFICDNGANIISKGKLLNTDILCPDAIKSVVDFSSGFDDLAPLVCGTKGAHVSKNINKKVEECILKYFSVLYKEDDLYNVDDNIFKISVCDAKGVMNGSFEMFNKEFKDSMEVFPSEKYWLDIMNKGINKGRGLKYFLNHFGISPDEVMAFGDYYNDESLVRIAKESYAMENAVDEIKRLSKYIAPSNRDFGVIRVIKKVLNIGEIEQ